MATSVRLLRRYVWLIDTIRRAGRLTFDEINQMWLDEKSIRLEDEDKIPERTFHRHREAIADFFGIEILCNRSDGNSYYIGNEETLNKPTFTSWLFNWLSLDNKIMGNQELTERVLFEDIPGGNEHIATIIKALTENRMLKISHRRFDKYQETEKIIEAYGLKQSGRRWYLVGKVQGSKGLLVFALDRIESVEMISETFIPDKATNFKTYFDEVVGINVDDDFDCEKIVVRIYGKQRAYVDALPIHKSQKIINRSREYSDYQFMVRPEYEFQHEILRLGASAEVLSPLWLREEFIWIVNEMSKRYAASQP